jgi:hypothetical protein
MDDSLRRAPDTGRATAPGPAPTYRCVVLPSGDLLPIEERLGRRLLRMIPPDCDEGRALLDEERVTLVRRPFGEGGRRREPATDH